MYSYGPPHMAVQKQDDQLELTYSNYVRTQDVTLKTCRRQWIIGRSGERGSGISVLAARHDDDDDSVSSTEKDIDTRLTKVIWKSDLTDKIKHSFFQAAVVSIQLYGCTTWTLAKRMKKKLDGNSTRMLRAILNKSWRQHPKKHQLYGHLPTKTIKVRRTRHAGHCWRSRDELIGDFLE